MNEATDIKFILRDPIRLKELLDESARSAEKLDRATTSAGRSADRAIGPYTRLERNVGKLVAGTAPGNSTSGSEFRDLVYNARQAQDKVSKLESPPKGFLRKSLSHISRVPMDGSSGANMALSAIGAAGPEGAAIALLGNAAIEAAGKMVQLAGSAAESGRRISELRVSVGGSNADAARLVGFGAGAGDVGNARNRALSDPYAYAAAQGAGVSFMPGPMGEATAGKDFVRLLEGIRKQSEAQQRISLRTLGLEGFAGLMKVSDKTFEQMRTDSQLTAKLLDNNFQVRSAEYQAAEQRLEGAKQRSSATAGKSFMEDITNLRNTASDILDTDAKWAASNPAGAKLRNDAVELLISPLGYLIARAAEVYQGNKGGAAVSKETEDRRMGETDRLSMAINRLAQGNVGSGEGFSNAIPGALQSGQNLAIAAAHGELAAMALH